MLAAALLVLLLLRWLHMPHPGYRVRAAALPGRRAAAKPAWVRREVLRLKALMPRAGCRTLAHCFNRRFAARRRITVGKTFVAGLICLHHHDLAMLRRQIKNARPRPAPRNLVWAVDLTGKATLDARTRLVLGILDHGSRAALRLEALQSKSSWNLVRSLCAAIERWGRPCAIRTDNESVFASVAFGLALFLLGIRHQRTDPHCPWQNGRVERFFGTLKTSLDRLAVDSFDALDSALAAFRFFYNHVRTHQNLAGATPAEAWAGVDPYASRVKAEHWFEAWDGLLQGYYLRR